MSRPRIQLPVESLAFDYEEDKLTGVELGARYGVSRQTVLRRLAEAGVEIHSEYTGSLYQIECRWCGAEVVSRSARRVQCDDCRISRNNNNNNNN